MLQLGTGLFGIFLVLAFLTLVFVVIVLPVGAAVALALGVRRVVTSKFFRPFDPRWVAVFDVAAGVTLMLAGQSTASRAIGAVLAVGAAGAGIAAIERFRVLGFAFLAGLGVLLAPWAALAIGISAAWRWAERDELAF